MHTATEDKRIPARIVKKSRKAYVLVTLWGQLKGLYQPGQLVICPLPGQYSDLPETPNNFNKYPLITLLKVV